MAVKFPQRTGLLYEDHEFWELVKGYNEDELNEVEEAYHETWSAFLNHPPRRTGEPAFEHSRRTALRVARRLQHVLMQEGRKGKYVALGLRHDHIEDTNASLPYKTREHGYRRLPHRYGEAMARGLLLVTRGPHQEEWEHLEQIEAGEDRFFRRIKGDDAPLAQNDWVVLMARFVKVEDRLDNMETYCLVYQAAQLRHKLDLSIRYYVRFNELATAVAPPEMVPALEEQRRELLECIVVCEQHLLQLNTPSNTE